jgi:hypothetical protein
MGILASIRLHLHSRMVQLPGVNYKKEEAVRATMIFEAFLASRPMGGSHGF